MKVKTTLLLLLAISSCKKTIKVYDRAGKIKESFDVENQLKTGIRQEFYSNGECRTKQYYLRDTLDGPVISFYNSGEINSIGTHKAGELEGYAIQYYQDGNIQSMVKFIQGKKEGIALNFGTRRTIIGRTWFLNDKNYYSEEYNMDGNLTNSSFDFKEIDTGFVICPSVDIINKTCEKGICRYLVEIKNSNIHLNLWTIKVNGKINKEKSNTFSIETTQANLRIVLGLVDEEKIYFTRIYTYN